MKKEGIELEREISKSYFAYEILKNHGINTKRVGAELFAEQISANTNNGLTFSEWLKVDEAHNMVGDEELMDWLGY